jgi:predicted transcriptional regulator
MMNLYNRYKAVDKIKEIIYGMLKLGVMTEGQVVKELNVSRSYANWVLKKMTEEGHLLKVMAPDPNGKRSIAYYKSTDLVFKPRTEEDIREMCTRRNQKSVKTRKENKPDAPIAHAVFYNLLDRKQDWKNPKPKSARRPVIAIGSSFSLY